MGPAVAYAFLTRFSVGWRGCYYLLIAVNVAALFCWVAFYFPPTFEDKHREDGTTASKMHWIKNFDYIGTFLFASGFIVFLLGMYEVKYKENLLTKIQVSRGAEASMHGNPRLSYQPY
jgi:MFS family permease